MTSPGRSGSTTENRLLDRDGRRQEPPARCRARRGPMRSGQKHASANHSAAEAGQGPMGSRQKPGSGGRDNGLPISLLLTPGPLRQRTELKSF